MKIYGAPIAAMTLLLACAFAQAQEPRPAPPPPPAEAVHYGWADVLRVDPVYDDGGPVPTSQPHEECYEEQVLPPPPPDNRSGGTLLGALIGGIIGHQFGKGSGRAATTAAGAVAGGVVGNNVAAANANGNAQPTTERHCRIVDNPASPRRIIAYDVEYRYRGELYNTRMNYDPGDRIRVRITVTPAEQ